MKKLGWFLCGVVVATALPAFANQLTSDQRLHQIMRTYSGQSLAKLDSIDRAEWAQVYWLRKQTELMESACCTCE